MSRRRTRQSGRSGRGAPAPAKRSWTWAGLAVGVLAVAIVGFVVLSSSDQTDRAGDPVPWATLGTADVHSLAFDPADAQHLYFGHHGGLLESRDGGRSWSPTSLTGIDAMNVETGSEGRIQIAGHEVYVESTDGGQSWAPVPNDLPGLDLHAYAMDPGDPMHVWAFAIGFGLFESTDGGRAWELRQAGNWPALAAYRERNATVLLGISAAGLQRSSDGGASWQALDAPSAQPITVAAAADGSAFYLATVDGLYTSSDGGASWARSAFHRLALALAIAANGPSVIALVDEETRFYRSPDAGSSFPGP